MLIACWSPKGGVGTSLLAAALTVRMHLLGARPLLVDLDPGKADQTALLQCADRPSLLDWSLLSGGTQRLSPEAVVAHPQGFHVLPGPARPVAEGAVTQELTERLLAALTGGWLQASATGERLRRSRHTAAPDDDTVVLDLASVLRDSTLVSLDRADMVLLVVTPDVLAARAVYQFSRELASLGLDGGRFHLVINRCGGGAGLNMLDLTDLLPFPVMAKLPSAPRLARAVNQGAGARAFTGRNPYTRAVDQILARIARGR